MTLKINQSIKTMAYNKFNIDKKRPLSLFWVVLGGLVLSILAPVRGEAEDSPSQQPIGSKINRQGPLIKSQIKELSGRLVLDAYTEVTQGLQADKYVDFVNVSTPTTPASGHSRLFANSAAKQFIAVYSDGTTQVFGSGSGSITWGSITGTLSTQTDLQNILTSLGSSTGTLRTDVTALGVSTAAVAVSTTSLQTQINAGATTYIQLRSTLQSGATFFVTSGTVNSLFNINGPLSLSGSQGTSGQVVQSAGAGAVPTWATLTGASLSSTQTWTGGNTFVAAVTMSSNTLLSGSTTIKGTSIADNAAPGYIGEYVVSSITIATEISAFGNGVYGDVQSISLTAGDWDISGILAEDLNSSTTTGFDMGISTTSGNSSANLTFGDTTIESLPANAVVNTFCVIPVVRKSFSTTTTVYLKGKAFYTVGTPKFYGRISARRVR